MSNDKYEIRRLALKELTESLGKGGIAAVADKIGKAPSYVSRMLYEPGKEGRKRIGEDSWEVILEAFPSMAADTPIVPVAGFATDDGYRVALLDAEAAMGNGIVNNDYPDVVREIDFDPAYIRALLGFVPKPGRLKLVTGRGDSMLPTIQPGDVVLVDTGCESFQGDGLYLINSGNGQQIKRLHDRGGTLYVFSDNPIYPAEPVNESTLIGGKVYLHNRLTRVG